MVISAALAGLGASFLWALAPLLGQGPARSLGAFEFTRIQLISAFAVLLILVTMTVGWSTVSPRHAPAYALGSLVGVVLTNLAMIACLRRGGAQRMQALFAMNAPFAAGLSYLALGETLSPLQVLGIGIGVAGVALVVLAEQTAIETGARTGDTPPGTLLITVSFGLAAAACNAVGLIALRPVADFADRERRFHLMVSARFI